MFILYFINVVLLQFIGIVIECIDSVKCKIEDMFYVKKEFSFLWGLLFEFLFQIFVVVGLLFNGVFGIVGCFVSFVCIEYYYIFVNFYDS